MATYLSQPGRFVVREVRSADVATCAAIEAACFPPAEAASPAKIAQRAAEYPQGFVVIEVDGAVVGMVNGAASSQPDLADEEFKGLVGHDPAGVDLVIFTVAVVPGQQGRGWSRPLIEGYLERARELGKRRVLLLCKERLVPYYARFGFVDRGLSASNHGGAAWHEMSAEITSPG